MPRKPVYEYHDLAYIAEVVNGLHHKETVGHYLCYAAKQNICWLGHKPTTERIVKEVKAITKQLLAF